MSPILSQVNLAFLHLWVSQLPQLIGYEPCAVTAPQSHCLLPFLLFSSLVFLSCYSSILSAFCQHKKSDQTGDWTQDLLVTCQGALPLSYMALVQVSYIVVYVGSGITATWVQLGEFNLPANVLSMNQQGLHQFRDHCHHQISKQDYIIQQNKWVCSVKYPSNI